MIVGFIGAGDMASTIARHALNAGHQVRMLGRNKEKLARTVAELGDGASAATCDEVLAADIVVLAVSWADVESALSGCRPQPGAILVDATNAIVRRSDAFEIAEFGDQISSEIVARLAPGARVVKAFNTIRTEDFRAGPWRGDARRMIMLSGDDVEAKATVKSLIEGFGFMAVDLGGLSTGGRLQTFGGPFATGHDFLAAGDTISERV